MNVGLTPRYQALLDQYLERELLSRDPVARAQALLDYLKAQKEDPPEYFTPVAMGQAIYADPSVAGRLLQQLMPVKPVRRKGYPSAKIYRHLETVPLPELLKKYTERYTAASRNA